MALPALIRFLPMTQHHLDEAKPGFRKYFLSSSRLEMIFVALGIISLVALVALAAFGFGDLGPGFAAGFVVWIVIWVIRFALGYDKAIWPPDKTSEITPAQRVDSAQRKSQR